MKSGQYQIKKSGRTPKLDHETIKSLLLEGFTCGQVAKKMGYKKASVEYVRRKFRIPATHKIDYNEIERLYNIGRNDQEISKAVCCCDDSVFKWRHKKGFPAVNRGSIEVEAWP